MNQLLPLAGKVAVITGSGRKAGLGIAIARRLARDGAKIILSDVTLTDEIEALATEFRQEGYVVATHACDVTDYDQVQALGQASLSEFGRLDIWVNNAGIGYIMKPLLEVSPQDWAKVIDVNLTGAFFGIKTAAEIMINQGNGGRIINIASQAAKSGFPHAQAYSASKHGLVGLVRSAAIELGAHGITLNNVCPNHVTTGLGAWQNEYFAKVTGHESVAAYMAAMINRIPMGRAGLAEDTANAVAFLCSEGAGYITAESMNVSGGEEPH